MSSLLVYRAFPRMTPLCAMDSHPRLQRLFSEIGIPQYIGECLINSGHTNASDFAFSWPDPARLEALIQTVLRDGTYPDGGILQNPGITNAALNIHPDAGRLKRLYQ